MLYGGKMKQFMALALLSALTAGAFAAADPQGAPAQTQRTKSHQSSSAASVARRLDEMQRALEAQQQQIQQLRQELQTRDSEIQQLQQQSSQAQSTAGQAEQKADTALSQTSQQQQTITTTTNEVSDLKSTVANTALSLQETQKSVSESPLAIKYKGITITPGGFVAAETVTRQRAASADINTPFTGIPFPGNSLSKVWESNLTARQSRLTLLGESKIGNVKLTGYWEADFLGTGVTSNNRQSNSYVLRQRVIYGQAAFNNGWSFTGGQMWSLATENKKSIENRTELPPLTIDSQYNVGFTWARQYGFRVVKKFGDKFAFGVAAEGPQATIGGRGFSSTSTINLATAATTTTGNTFIDAPGSGGGLFNFIDTSGYSLNKSPDFIVKFAADPGFGHYEVFGIVSPFRNRVFPCGVVGTNATDTVVAAVPTTIACPVDGSAAPSAAGAFNDTRTGGGGGFNFRLPIVAKKLEFAFQGLVGDGVGRYGSAQIADLTFRPDGTAALIRTGHGLSGLEYHSNKLEAYAYAGAEYGSRAAYRGYDSITVTKTPAIPATTTTPAIPSTTTTAFKLNQIGGYGSPFANNSGCTKESPPANQLTPSSGGSCAGDTRVIMEGTLGFWYKFYQGPRGGLRLGIQYSYFSKNGWSGNNNIAGAPGFAPKAVDNMFWTSLRYYIP
jgi:flagellar motor protein MotB